MVVTYVYSVHYVSKEREKDNEEERTVQGDKPFPSLSLCVCESPCFFSFVHRSQGGS